MQLCLMTLSHNSAQIACVTGGIPVAVYVPRLFAQGVTGCMRVPACTMLSIACL